MLNKLKILLDDPELTYQERLQALWSDYGEIARYYSPKLTSSIIVKSVSPPSQVNHPRGWHSNVSHQRKLNSYKIEENFYQHYAHHCPASCYVPQLITATKISEQTDEQLLVMEDLTQLGFNNKIESISLTNIKAIISWLANFHALFLGDKAESLWPIGTYWHLTTRTDEYHNMEESSLKSAAEVIDNTLNNAQYQTIVHGDAKLANFCINDALDENLSPKKIRVAAVDFQYVGKGIGVKDLAYFLGSCLNSEELTLHHDELLNFYFKQLTSACQGYHKGINYLEVEKEWRQLYCFANADFLRFLKGWSPEHHKINAYLNNQCNLALRSIFK